MRCWCLFLGSYPVVTVVEQLGRETIVEIRSELLQAISSAIARYGLLDTGEEIVVAFSGGKDSIGLSLCLVQLGYAVEPVAIDMGYESGWGQRIQALGESMGFSVEVVDVRHGAPMSIPSTEYRKIQLRLEVLNSINPAETSTVTPCTHCYNSKVIALDNVVRQKGKVKVAFAHHLTDACSSLLKEGLLRIDHLDREHSSYSRSNFESLVDQLSTEARAYPESSSPLLERLAELVDEGRIDTDEPPRQPLRTDRPGVDIVRPLFGVWEEALVELSTDLGLVPEGSGCGHGATANTETPREMVHYRVLRQATPRLPPSR